MKITIIFEWFIVLMWKNLNFQLFCFCYSVVYVRTVFTEAQPGPTLTALYFEIAYSLLRKIPEREFQILTLMNFHEPLEIKCNFQRPSSSDSPLIKVGGPSLARFQLHTVREWIYNRHKLPRPFGSWFGLNITCILHKCKK